MEGEKPGGTPRAEDCGRVITLQSSSCLMALGTVEAPVGPSSGPHVVNQQNSREDEREGTGIGG